MLLTIRDNVLVVRETSKSMLDEGFLNSLIQNVFASEYSKRICSAVYFR